MKSFSVIYIDTALPFLAEPLQVYAEREIAADPRAASYAAANPQWKLSEMQRLASRVVGLFRDAYLSGYSSLGQQGAAKAGSYGFPPASSAPALVQHFRHAPHEPRYRGLNLPEPATAAARPPQPPEGGHGRGTSGLDALAALAAVADNL